MKEHNAPRTGQEEFSESVHGHTNIPVLNKQGKSQAPQLAKNPFIHEFVQMMKIMKIS